MAIRSIITLAAPLLAASPALAQEIEYISRWEDGQRMFLPNAIAPATRRFAVGEVLFEAPLRWVRSLRLQQDVAITFEGNSVTLPAGTQLPLASFYSKAKPSTVRFAFCTRFGIVNTASTFINDRWLFKTPFDAKNKQLCLEDTDRDGMLDRSFVRTTQSFLGRPDMIYTGPVSHSAKTAEFLAPIDDAGDMVRYRVSAVGKSRVDLRIELSIQHNAMIYSTLQTSGYDIRPITSFRQTGTTVNLLGIDVRLDSFDPVGKSAEFEFGPSQRANPIMIPSWVTGY
jgi:hypothetical protein